MAKRNSVVTLLMTTPYEWSADYGRQTAIELSNNSYVFCYIWHNMLSVKEIFTSGFRIKLLERKNEAIWVYTAVHWLPFKRFSFIVRLNEFLNVLVFNFIQKIFSFKLKTARKIVWVFDPGYYHLLSLFKFDFLVYDCLDFFAGVLTGKERKLYETNEKLLMLRADIVAANSHFHYNRIMEITSKVLLVPQGFDEKSFLSNSKIKTTVIPKSSPIIGYVGGINSRLNFNLLFKLIDRHPSWQFVFWGPIQIDQGNDLLVKNIEKLQSFSNVTIGQSERKYLRSIIRQFDVGIIPYLETDFNVFCFPMKLFEYFYFGKQVISSEIDELQYYKKSVYIAKTINEWEASLSKVLSTKLRVADKNYLKFLSQSHSWKNKIDMIQRKIYESNHALFGDYDQ